MSLSFMTSKALINERTRASPLCHPSSFLKNWITAWNRLVAVILYIFCLMIGAFPTPLKRTTTRWINHVKAAWVNRRDNERRNSRYPWKNPFSCMFQKPLVVFHLPNHCSDSTLEERETLVEELIQGFRPFGPCACDSRAERWKCCWQVSHVENKLMKIVIYLSVVPQNIK